MEERHVRLPMTDDEVASLKCGDMVLVSGVVYTARDAAHKRMREMLDRGERLPFELCGATIYYTGPTPAKPGRVIGSAGPTTSYRMDPFTPAFLDMGLRAMIGKGRRSPEVVEAVRRNRAVYFCAVGGAGALISKCVKSSEVVAFADLDSEAVRKLVVEDMPVFVAIDSSGNSLY